MGYVTLTPDPTIIPLGEVIRMDYFDTIDISASLSVDGSITSTTIIPQFDISEEDELIIVNGVSSASIGGRYKGRFFDVIKYLPPCTTDKLIPLTTVIGIGNVPEGKQIVEFIQDVSVQWYPLYYVVEVSYDYVIDSVPGSDTETFMYEHRNMNDWERPGEWLEEYVKRNTFTGCFQDNS